jgi:hypothetical protein
MSEQWRRELEELIVEFAFLADGGSHAKLVTLFTSDGCFIIPDLPLESGKVIVYRGHDQLRQRWGGAVAHATCHIMSMPRLRRTGVATASGVINMISYRGAAGGIPPAHEPFIVGRFEDRYSLENGTWLIGERRLVAVFAGAALVQPTGARPEH